MQQHVLGADEEHLLELTDFDRARIFNLGYYTWVEQRGLSLEEFSVRAKLEFWQALRGALMQWDEAILELNAEVVGSA